MIDWIFPGLGSSRGLGNLGICAVSQEEIARVSILAAEQRMSNQAQLDRLASLLFYRSCSKHWLDAMLDVEIGA